MELEELIAKISSGECLTDNIEDNFNLGLALAYLEELRQWRENPFTQIKEHCEAMDKCIECDWLERGCPNCFVTTPEDWKL
jgi:CO dehydrogenase/acetyl-CoA synthase alpha subunit